MAIETITRTAKRYYEELKLQSGRQLYNALFPTVDSSTEEAFLLDSLIQDPYGVAYREADMQSALRSYTPGSGKLFTPPRASEKTPISESLLGKVAAGIEETAGFSQNEAKIIGDIVRQHVAAFNMTKNKQALDVFVNGTFSADGPGGVDLGLDIDFGRAAGNALTYDYTAGGATFTEAVEEMQTQLIAQGCPLSNMAILCGQSWLTEYSSDAGIDSGDQNNAMNFISESPLLPPMLGGTEGLYVVGRFRSRKMIAPVWVLSYSPGIQYTAYKGAAAAPFIADVNAIGFSLDSQRWNVQRGVRAKNDAGVPVMLSGDLVTDTFSVDDPVTTFVRSQTRHAFIPSNVDHTVVSVGTFS